MPLDPDLIRDTEAASDLGQSLKTIQRWIGKGRLAGVQIGRKYFASRAAVDRMRAVIAPPGPAATAPPDGAKA